MKKALFPKNEYWDWYLFTSICLYQIIPLLYNSYNIYLIGNSIPGENNLAIVSQWQFIQVIIEIIEESMVFPIFFFVGSTLKSDNIKLIERRVNTSIKIILAVIIPVALLLLPLARKFVSFIDTPTEIIDSTIVYLRIKIWTLIVSICSLGLIIIVKSLNKKQLLITLLIYKMILSIVLDSLFFGRYNFSLGLGIRGVALSNLLTEGLLLILILWKLKKSMGINIFRDFTTFRKVDLKLFGKIGIGIGIESAVKNIAYLTMIITMINSLGAEPIGGYYLTMYFFWGFLLIPINSLTETLKVLIANNALDLFRVKSLLKYGITIGSITVLLWLIIFPFAENIFHYLNKNEDLVYYAKKAFYILIVPYGILAINMIIDSVFYGLGETKYLAYQSIITNLAVYFVAFILYKAEIWIPSFGSILILFSIGILLDTILTITYMNMIFRLRKETVPKKDLPPMLPKA